jgi:glycolate oxidase FAD binding subunit
MDRADLTSSLSESVRQAAGEGRPLCIQGGNTKTFYGRTPQGNPLQVAAHKGIVSYEPTELVLTARAGTPLEEIENVLSEQHQMLAFDPPRFGEAATLGGTIACGISGPRRPYAGAARDFVLGTRMINGNGEALHFGGQVMKNVAGYDVSRLMCGALGTLGVLLEVSLKVLPRPAEENTLALEVSDTDALELMNGWFGKPLPLSAACHDGERLYVRLSGAASAVRAARSRIGGESVADADTFWQRVRELRHGFFIPSQPLWRLSVPAAAPALTLKGKWFIDWGGAQRWLRSDEPDEHIREVAAQAGGHAAVFRGGDRAGTVFQPPAPGLMEIHRRLKSKFDPHGIFNPGRMYAEL